MPYLKKKKKRFRGTHGKKIEEQADYTCRMWISFVFLVCLILDLLSIMTA